MSGAPVECFIRPVGQADREGWMSLWAMYCASHDAELADRVTERTWQRIVAPSEPIHALIAFDAAGDALGMCNYVCHPHTWSEQTVCYLEDVFVAPSACRLGIATALIHKLRDIGQDNNWSRIYWMTRGDNVAAQAAYDRIAARTDHVRFEISFKN